MSERVQSPPGRRSARYLFWEWIRHHAAAVFATAVDFGVMVACVELLHLRPVPATVIGASCGAVTNFVVNRGFTYRAGHGRASRQGLRFALVSAASLGLNALGMYLLFDLLHLQYMLARLITAVIVSNAWNYPLLRFFVFSHKAT